jgi:hypothetical protein
MTIKLRKLKPSYQTIEKMGGRVFKVRRLAEADNKLWSAFNPSIAYSPKYGYAMTIRSSNYVINLKTGHLEIVDGGEVASRLWFCELDEDFSLLNLSFDFVKIFSTGVILKKHTNFFKFFKKSIFNINPLVMVIRYSFVDFFKNLYIIECLNYSKKQFLFLKKFLNSVNITVKYMLFKKT